MASRCFSAAATFAAVSFLAGSPLGAQPADRSQTEALARRAGVLLTALQREADRLASEEGTLLNDLRKLEVERLLRAEELKQIDGEAGHVEHDLAAASARTETLRQSEAMQAPEL